jgi:hypothetical protein
MVSITKAFALPTPIRGLALEAHTSSTATNVKRANTNFLHHLQLVHLVPAIVQWPKRKTHSALVSNAIAIAFCTLPHFADLLAKPKCLCSRKTTNALASPTHSKSPKLQPQ